MRNLPRKFYDREPSVVARELLGKCLAHRSSGGTTVVRIVETEAYEGKNDPASHSYVGLTPRNWAIFEGPGHAYVYFIYGNHYCFNVTTRANGAVLIRAGEPISGTEIMQRRRRVNDFLKLTSGPGNLTKAMAMNSRHNGADLVRDRNLFIYVSKKRESFEIVRTRRVGIAKAKNRLLRFYIKGNDFVSGPK